MYKIFKYYRLKQPKVQTLHEVVRYMSCQNNNSCKQQSIPPTFECKRKSDYDEEGMPLDIPLVFQCRKPKDPKVWKKIFFFICCPAILIALLDVYVVNSEKHKRPKFITYEYLRIRKKPFPWHPVKTLFHNPLVNALPDGYETPDEDDDEEDNI